MVEWWRCGRRSKPCRGRWMMPFLHRRRRRWNRWGLHWSVNWRVWEDEMTAQLWWDTDEITNNTQCQRHARLASASTWHITTQRYDTTNVTDTRSRDGNLPRLMTKEWQWMVGYWGVGGWISRHCWLITASFDSTSWKWRLWGEWQCDESTMKASKKERQWKSAGRTIFGIRSGQQNSDKESWYVESTENTYHSKVSWYFDL